MNKAITIRSYHLIPIIFFIAVIPLIVYMKIIPLTELEINNWTGGKQHVDFFSYYKSIFIIITGAVSLITLIYKLYNNDIRIKHINYYYIPIFIYTIFVILSAFL